MKHEPVKEPETIAAYLMLILHLKLKKYNKKFEDVDAIQFFDDPSLERHRLYGVYGWAEFVDTENARIVEVTTCSSWRFTDIIKPEWVIDLLDRWIRLDADKLRSVIMQNLLFSQEVVAHLRTWEERQNISNQSCNNQKRLS